MALAIVMDALDRVLLFRSWEEAKASVDGLARLPPVALSGNCGKPSAQSPTAVLVGRVHVRGSPGAAHWAPPPAGSAYDEALLVTNVQKAVRRRLPQAAARSAAQFLRQATSGTARRELLRRAPIVAAEDSSATPLLAALLFAHMTATTLPPSRRDLSLVVAAYAQLAAAPRDEQFDEFCERADNLGAQYDGFPPLDEAHEVALGLLRWVEAAAPVEAEAREARRENAALVLLLHVHATCERRPGAERTWLAASAHAWRLRASEDLGGWSDARWRAWRAAHALRYVGGLEATGPDAGERLDICAPLRAEDRLFFSADYHSRARMDLLAAPLARALGSAEPGALRAAMSEHCLRNVRDAPLVHALTCRRGVPAGSALARQEAFVERWSQLAAQIWSARPAGPIAPGGKGASGAKRPAADAREQKSIRSFFGGGAQPEQH